MAYVLLTLAWLLAFGVQLLAEDVSVYLHCWTGSKKSPNHWNGCHKFYWNA